MSGSYVLDFEKIDLAHLPLVGGKNASLGELLTQLSSLGVRVPRGFAITVDAYRAHLAQSGVEQRIAEILGRLDVHDVGALNVAGREVRELIRSVALPSEVEHEVAAAYRSLSSSHGEDETDVAVRSSATAEDLPSASFAGQQDTYLNIRGQHHLMAAVRDCMASLFTDRAIVYRAERNFDHMTVALSVGVQKMVRSDLASAGVIFTLDTESGFRDVILVTGAWGLGETVVQGRVNPDEFWVHKPTLKAGFASLLRREAGDKRAKLVYAEGTTKAVKEVPVAAAQRQELVLSDEEVLTLARWAALIEDHYSARAGEARPMDIEWGKDGRTGELFILQARPETVHSQAGPPQFESFILKSRSEVLLRGKSVGNRIGAGRVRVVRAAGELTTFQPGEVLVAPMTDPDWEPVLRRAAAVVTDQGGRTCHAAIVSRELGIPCVVGSGSATQKLETGREVTVSCAEGDEGKVYDGILQYQRDLLDPGTLPTPRVPVMLNVGTPENAFFVGQLPSAGVGLARLEFIVSSWIGIHPMALVHPERITKGGVVKTIIERTRGYSSPSEFFVDRLASGVGQIAAAFYPRPVIVRLSDFKTNEYAGLIGGADFEPVENNPMLGFRGAARYYDERYRAGFALECQALLRVRKTMGLSNVKLMVPFCRTLEEGRKVLVELEKNGLKRGEDGLEIYVMCEIPNNAILADEFSELFDGFSIGSNDLTQLTLGVDRDSELLAHIFSERDPGVLRLIGMVIAAAHRHGKKVGICGQAPSDHPEYAAFLADQGIDSVSVTPDALPRVIQNLGKPGSS